MTGQGKSSKPFYVNIGNEDIFGQEAGSYYAPFGEFSGLPKLDIDRTVIEIPSGTELGKVKTSKPGISNNKISLPIGAFYNWRAISHIMGGRIDQEAILEVGSVSGTFQANEDITGGTSGAKAVISSVSGTDIMLKNFTKDETLTGGTSGATGKLWMIKDDVVYLTSVSGTFAAGETVTGGSSGAKLVINAVYQTVLVYSRDGDFTVGETVTGGTSGTTGVVQSARDGNLIVLSSVSGSFTADETLTGGTSGTTAKFKSQTLDTFTRKKFQDSETVTGGTSTATATVSDIVYDHYVFAEHFQDSKSIVYVNKSITEKQHLGKGAVCENVSFKGVHGKEVISGTIDYRFSQYMADATIDAQVTLESNETPYQYSDISLIINGTDYGKKFKTAELQLSRSQSPVPSGSEQNPKGFKNSVVETKVNYMLLMEDYEIIDLVTNNTEFTITQKYIITANKKQAVFTITAANYVQSPEESDSVIMQKFSPIVHGTPTINIRDYHSTHD